MSSNKFFIGLGTSVPSTRVLKPPGGDCSDLFGLKTRQKSQIKCLKGTSSVIDYLLRQQDPNDSHLRNIASRKTSEPLLTSMNKSRTTPSTSLAPTNAGEPSTVLHDSSESFRDLSDLTESDKSYSTKKSSQFDMNLIGDNFDGLSIKDGSLLDNISNQKSRKTSSQNGELSCVDGKGLTKLHQMNDDSKMSLNSNVSTRTTLHKNNSLTRSKTSDGSKMSINKELDKKFIRNPITGTLTEVKSWNKSNPVISKLSSMQEIKSKATKSAMSTCLSATLDDPLKVPSRASARRNPITGEGFPLNTHFSSASHNRIRVIHPPGGLSSGIY